MLPKRHIFLLLIITTFCYGQKKQEQEFRIDRHLLPGTIMPLLSEYLKDVKRLRFYKELDGEKSSYEVKFKKDKLLYSIEFDQNGQLEDVEFIIKEIDIPAEALKNIVTYLNVNHQKNRIKKIQQQHINYDNPRQTLKEALQNLILPEIRYELIISAKDEKGFGEYELTFDADGKHLLTRKSIKTKYDHVLFQ